MAAMLVTSAKAADLSEPKPYDWSGVFLGVNGGYAFDSDDKIGITFSTKGSGLSVSDADLGDINLSGIVGGAQIGYNYQIDNIVLGVVGDLQFGGMDDSFSTDVPDDNPLIEGKYTGSGSVDYFGTLRGRMGYAFDRIQFYGTGGLAWAHTDFDAKGTLATDGSTFHFSDSGNDFGWTVGAGAEYAVHDSVVLGVEYLYVNLGSESLSGPVINANIDPGLDARTSADTSFSLVRATLNWKF